ncbi:hypothetical protein GCM10007320_26060 [Pseudorhodoferax aquiterrae]|uniref:Cupin type-2 domain-containing protein n=1 Tax=Pseudorhodoferax aquiterrae TaxID=747304 RepID=A0ABQ3G244_9BURK|nr:cupin domain-containing protein [Pseudorhodoferax aquiterrae]GHC82696.1 hypothetical protein GCM10007320_26060 [Pseudorhodoferax aquiterrae]
MPAAMRMAAMGPQRHAAPADAAQARARFFNSANAFNIRLPPVPAHSFAAEARRAMDPQAPTGWQPCDQSQAMGSGNPATTPLMLARYAHIAPGETLASHFVATGAIWYVIAGSGCTQEGACALLAWSAGDVFHVPGTRDLRHTAGPEGATLWVVTDEPMLAEGGLAARATDEGVVHYPAAEIARQLALVYAAEPEPDTSGRALIFSSEGLEASHNIHRTMTLSLNTLPPGESQAAHRHNSAAITLIVDGEDCHSMVGGERIGWERWTTMVTPPGAPHSHHNGAATRRALFLIVQDGQFHYRARTMGFAPV